MAEDPGNPGDPANIFAALLKAQADAAEALRETVYALAEPHAKSLVAHRVTISVGDAVYAEI